MGKTTHTWVNEPTTVCDPQPWMQIGLYPCNITGYNDDGTYEAIIDEDSLTTVKRTMLSLGY